VRLLTREVEGPPAGVRAWLFQVATHLVRDRYRVTENRRRLLATYPGQESADPDAQDRLERDQKISAVRSALDTLSERDRVMLLMREEGFNYREIGEAVSVQPTSVGTLLARAQQRFAEAFGEHEGGEWHTET
jgi:RNA polymerase sigma-70 factor (ECF subfamily)